MWVFFLCLFIYCLYCSKFNGDPRLNVLCRKLSQGWNSIVHLLSAFEQLYTCLYLPTGVSRINICQCWWQKSICHSTATNEKQKMMSLAYASDIDIKMHTGDEGERKGRVKSLHVRYLCVQVKRIQKVANTTALKVCVFSNVCASLR